MTHLVHVNLAKGFSGGERQTELLIRHLAGHGVTQTLVCRAGSMLRERLHDVPVTFVSAQQVWHGQGRVARATLIHAHEARAVHWAWLQHLWRSTPYIVTRRIDKPMRPHAANRLFYRQAAVVVGLSSVIVMQVQALVPKRVVCIPSVCAHLVHDPDESARLRAVLKTGFVVGHVGTLRDSAKGQRVLLQAARLLREQVPDMQFLFLGSGPDAADFAHESRDLPNVHWLGFHNNVADYLRLFDVFAFPSRTEGLGSTLLDAMEHGVPIVASNVGGIPDIVHDEKTGLLVPVGDAHALAQALLRLYQQPALRSALVAQARDALSEYTPQRMAQRYLALYRDIVGDGAGF